MWVIMIRKEVLLKLSDFFKGESAFEDKYKVEKSEDFFLQVFNNLWNLNS